MSGQPGANTAAPLGTLGEMLRVLREAAGKPGWEVAAAAHMDSTLLSKIENGRRLPTESQLGELAAFFQIEAAPLQRQRLAEELTKRYGAHPEFGGAMAIVQESAGEYRVKKQAPRVNKGRGSVNNRRKSP